MTTISSTGISSNDLWKSYEQNLTISYKPVIDFCNTSAPENCNDRINLAVAIILNGNCIKSGFSSLCAPLGGTPCLVANRLRIEASQKLKTNASSLPTADQLNALVDDKNGLSLLSSLHVINEQFLITMLEMQTAIAKCKLRSDSGYSLNDLELIAGLVKSWPKDVSLDIKIQESLKEFWKNGIIENALKDTRYCNGSEPITKFLEFYSSLFGVSATMILVENGIDECQKQKAPKGKLKVSSRGIELADAFLGGIKDFLIKAKLNKEIERLFPEQV